ncbi:alpha/beta-hydrolase [Lindgomyces ingoldianus]|uniref:Alpha/beta-hydrolase n=1 Tax=Lindgomyces ingoldianus TaxID=673940 RepID=A0ACB6QP59_9PLEO|nr:alpha/beta-hydrolase [Lindgomyces ingoldianus]KAF2468660.1 alpha/beta-hydrolase [Lindgomyces ingoldianus]
MLASDSSPRYPQHIDAIPYTDPPTKLQTLDIWLPRPQSKSPPSSTIWIIYIHGGAWRDPLQNSATIHPTIHHLSHSTHPTALRHIAGIASLNYRLSPYPLHPTHPSSPDDESRNVRHPSHVQDVALALKWLRREYGIGVGGGDGDGDGERQGYKWIGIGHSCGSTLLLQLFSRIGVSPQDLYLSRPAALVLLAGIYNIPLLVQNHSTPKTPKNIAEIYKDIVTGAFGPDVRVWEGASPTSHAHSFGDEGWGNGRLLLLCWSPEDGLVEGEQMERMSRTLLAAGWKDQSGDNSMLENQNDMEGGDRKKIFECRKLEGAHDEVWQEGGQIVQLIEEVVGRMHGSGGLGTTEYWPLR